MKLLFVASELAPFAKTGGLADVMSALPKYLHRAGHDVRVFIPFYDTVATSKAVFERVGEHEVPLGAHRYRLEIFKTGDAPVVYLARCPALFARGRLYTEDADEHRRFLALSFAALLTAREQSFVPDVIHAHDWQAALLPMIVKSIFAKDLASTRTLLTIHNLAYQGGVAASIVPTRTWRCTSSCSIRSCWAPAASTSCCRASCSPTASAR